MGAHKFKDALQATRVFQVLAPDLQSDFPALRALDIFPNNLPTQITAFIGREKEIAEIDKALADHRQITITGSGGTGKTRLAIEVGAAQVAKAQTDQRFANGVYFVTLAPLENTEYIVPTVASALGFSFYEGGEPRQQILDYPPAHTLDFRECAPLASRRDMYVTNGKLDSQASKRGGLAVATPGEVAGVTLALERFGTKSFAEVAAPAIRLARDGFVVEDHLASMIAAFSNALAKDAGLASVFLHGDGTPIRAGETLRRPELARTLETIAKGGPSAFYGGDIAADMVATVRARGGTLAAEDLARYRVVQRPPVFTPFAGWQVVGMPPPSSGGGIIGELLNVLAGKASDGR